MTDYLPLFREAFRGAGMPLETGKFYDMLSGSPVVW
jgi:hypothetical protein